MLMFGEYPNIVILCEEPIYVTHCKNIKLIFTMHPSLINMDLQEDMIIKGIKYIQSHPKIFIQDHVNVFDKYLHYLCVSVKIIIMCDNNISVSIKSSDL